MGFNTNSMPNLMAIVQGIFGSCTVAFIVLNWLGPGPFTRCIAAGLAMLIMKLLGAVFPPAGALCVMFIDNAKAQELGLFYSLMPGLSGSAVLITLAVLRIK